MPPRMRTRIVMDRTAGPNHWRGNGGEQSWKRWKGVLSYYELKKSRTPELVESAMVGAGMLRNGAKTMRKAVQYF
ncbi:hypothetical protein Tco_0102745 [Tanacetum coccineum]